MLRRKGVNRFEISHVTLLRYNFSLYRIHPTSNSNYPATHAAISANRPTYGPRGSSRQARPD